MGEKTRDLVRKILADIVQRAGVEEVVRWQNAIAQARLDQIPSVDYTHFLADFVVKQLIQGKWGNDASSDHRRVVQMHEASASALYNVTGRIVSEKVIHLQASTLGEIIAEVPSHVSVNQTSLLATQGHNCAWMTPHSLSAGGSLLREIAVAALVAKMYDWYFRGEHFQIQTITP